MTDETKVETSSQELKYFNVKNITEMRPVYMGAVLLLPGEVKAILDDPEGINRQTVEADLWLDFTDEEPAEEIKQESAKEQAKTAPKKQTATGKSWGAK